MSSERGAVGGPEYVENWLSTGHEQILFLILRQKTRKRAEEQQWTVGSGRWQGGARKTILGSRGESTYTRKAMRHSYD